MQVSTLELTRLPLTIYHFMSDFYDILGVSKGASQDEIKKAFRKKAHELHPDKGGDEKAFKAVNEAYQTLGDEQKRKAYDQFGHAGYQQMNGSGFGNGGGGFGGFGNGFEGVNINFDDLGDLGDVIGNMFGFGGGQRRGTRGGNRGRDVETNVTIELMEAFRGLQKEIRLKMNVVCEHCGGNGAEKGSKRVTCTTCQGQGRVMRIQQTPFGSFQTAVPCSVCEGIGTVPEKACPVCRGKGIISAEKEIQFDIPAGIDDGETIRINAAGEAAPYGGHAGDLYIHLRVRPDERFERKGNDIITTAKAPMSYFAIGGEIVIQTLEGPFTLEIPSGTPSGAELKLKGKGFPYLHGKGRGDHFVIISPEIPKKLSREEKEAFEQLKKLGL